MESLQAALLEAQRQSRPVRMVPMAPPETWVMLDRLAAVREAGGDAGASLSVRWPPGLSRVTAHTRSRISPDDGDPIPYVVAADSAGCLLLRLDAPLSFGAADASPTPPRGSLVVVRDFDALPVDSACGDAVARASVVPSRAHLQPPFSNVKHVGLVSHPHPDNGGEDYVVSELHVVSADHARLRYFRSGTAAWAVKELPMPVITGNRNRLYGGFDHEFDDVVSHDGNLWWVNLSSGLLSCDPFDEQPELRYTPLPVANLQWTLDIETSRLVRVSRGRLQFVAMTRAGGEPPGATRVLVQTLVDGLPLPGHPPSLTWQKETETKLEQFWPFWATEGYRSRELPEEVPLLAAVHPRNPDVLYFFLSHYLVGVNVRENSVLPYALDTRGEDDRPRELWWRYVLAWELPYSLATSLPIKSTLLATKYVGD